MTYERQVWNNYVTGNTPLSSDRLNHMEEGILENSEYVEGLKGSISSSSSGDLTVSGRIGAKTIRLESRPNLPPGPNVVGDISVVGGKLMICVTAGSPGAWESPTTEGGAGGVGVADAILLAGDAPYSINLTHLEDDVGAVAILHSISATGDVNIDVTGWPPGRDELILIIVGSSNVSSTTVTVASATMATAHGSDNIIVRVLHGSDGAPRIFDTNTGTSILYHRKQSSGWDSEVRNVTEALDLVGEYFKHMPSVARTGRYEDLLNIPNVTINGGGAAIIKRVSQMEYDSLATPDPNTVYLVVD